MRSTRHESNLCAGLGALLLAWALLLSPQAQAQENPRALLKLGLEHDSNARRQTGSEIKPDQLTRLFFKIAAPLSLGPVGSFHAKLLLGAKSYQFIIDENTLVSSLALSWSIPLSDDLSLFARFDGSDRSEATSRRDYTRFGFLSGVALRLDALQASVFAGYRNFIFKPDLSSNHRGLSLGLDLSLSPLPPWSISSRYALIQRQFDTDRLFATSDAIISSDQGVHRLDWLHSWDIALSWQGDALVRLRYSLQVNTSNSVGLGLIRHTGEAFWVQPLPLDLSLQLRASILRTTFDPTPVADRTLQLDDENRNLLLASLRYRLPLQGLSLESRYALYTQALGEDSGYIRHLILLGVIVTFDDDDTSDSQPLE